MAGRLSVERIPLFLELGCCSSRAYLWGGSGWGSLEELSGVSVWPLHGEGPNLPPGHQAAS